MNHFAFVNDVASDYGTYREVARAILARAQRREPMNFNMEVEKLWIDVALEELNAESN